MFLPVKMGELWPSCGRVVPSIGRVVPSIGRVVAELSEFLGELLGEIVKFRQLAQKRLGGHLCLEGGVGRAIFLRCVGILEFICFKFSFIQPNSCLCDEAAHYTPSVCSSETTRVVRKKKDVHRKHILQSYFFCFIPPCFIEGGGLCASLCAG